jgi:hypothetical protein|tara:strand:+ start:516 stop:635 length:120 start_codon:yes stop_codon:yes gene_type:complete
MDPIAITEENGTLMAQNIRFGAGRNSGELLIDDRGMPSQ